MVVVAALALTWFLEFRHRLGDFDSTLKFVTTNPRVFFFNAFLVGLVLIILSAIFRKPWTSIGVLWSLLIVMSYIHITKFGFRGQPLLPEDFQLADQATTLLEFINWISLAKMLVSVALVIILTFLLNFLTSRFFLQNKGGVWWKKYNLIPRALMIVAALLCLVVSTDFVRNHHGQKYEDAPWLNTWFIAWNQVQNYDKNGFILGFLYNLGYIKLQPPDGYSEEKIRDIAEKYTTRKNNATGLSSLSDANYNIVIILDESFYDPDIVREYYKYDGEVLAEFHKLAKKYPTGQMYSIDYGGGTANIEFETFTGLTNYWSNTVPYIDILPRLKQFQSVATFAKEHGYATTAIHPYNGGMYKRNLALKVEGFDTFITNLEMDFTERDGKSLYINDKSSFQQTLKVLNDSEQKQLVGLITMQNHEPYLPNPYGTTDFPVESDYEKNPEIISKLGAYYQSLHKSDSYFGDFIRELDKSDEKTVVLMYGDHNSGTLGGIINNENKTIRDLTRKTPYIIYANFDIEKADLPTTTPNCLVNTMYNVLKVQKPTLNYLLDEVCKQVPILTPFYLGEEGLFQSTEISEYEMVNYDILGGEQYWYKYTN